MITRPKEQSSELRSQLEQEGAEVITIPLIAVKEAFHSDRVEEVFSGMGIYSWIIFSSGNGVRSFFDLFFERFQDIRCIGGARIACVGPVTAEAVRKYHLAVDIVPTKATGQDLAEAMLEEQTLENESILVITGNRGKDLLVKKLEEGGAIVDTLPVYETQYRDISGEEGVNDFKEKGADAIFFMSGSAVESFVSHLKELQIKPKGKKPMACSIGPVTSEVMRQHGIFVDLEADPHTMEGLVIALKKRIYGL